MVYKELSEADKQAYMDFWSERKPESFALAAWIDKLAIATRQFRTNTLKGGRNISRYSEDFHKILETDGVPHAVYGIYDGMQIIDLHMRLIHKHEKRGTSLMAVSAIEDRLNEVGELFNTGAKEDNWAHIVDGEKRLRAPLDVKNYDAYNKYSWLSECHTAQDVAATLWTNFFHKLTNEIRQNNDARLDGFNFNMIFSPGSEPGFSTNMPFGVVRAPDGASFRSVVAEANSCLFQPGDVFSKELHEPRVTKAIVCEFLDKVDSFVGKMSPNLLVEFKL